MALRNRVDPFGALHAVSARGMFMGNRGGRFHDDNRSIGQRTHVSRRWICCLCDFRNRHRTVWGDSYTELFFLDEVTALSAGHRPCFECRRADALAFQSMFPFAETERPCADAMDRHLHVQRRANRRAGVAAAPTHMMAIGDIPDGTMCVAGGMAHAWRGGRLLPWSFAGYRAPVALPDIDLPWANSSKCN